MSKPSSAADRFAAGFRSRSPDCRSASDLLIPARHHTAIDIPNGPRHPLGVIAKQKMVETIYGCKWSLTVYQLLANGIKRPGEMVRSVEGLTTKVLNECLRKNVAFGIIERIAYNEIPPRVEYVITPFGRKFVRILDDLDKLQKEIASEHRQTSH